MIASHDIRRRHAADHLAVNRAGRRPHVEIPFGRCLDDTIYARRQVVELIAARGVGSRDLAGGDIVTADQLIERQRDAGDSRVVGIIVVVEMTVVEYGARDAGR